MDYRGKTIDKSPVRDHSEIITGSPPDIVICQSGAPRFYHSSKVDTHTLLNTNYKKNGMNVAVEHIKMGF